MGSIASAWYSEPLDGEGVLGGVHDLVMVGLLAPQRPAELAHHPTAIEEDQLTDQRSPMAVDAPMTPFPESPHARRHEVYFENGSRPR
jgi:hypothetical protein